MDGQKHRRSASYEVSQTASGVLQVWCYFSMRLLSAMDSQDDRMLPDYSRTEKKKKELNNNIHTEKSMLLKAPSYYPLSHTFK